LLKNEVNAGDKSIRLVYGGNVLTEPDKVRIKNNMKDFSLEDATVEIEQGFSSNTQDYNEAELLKNKLNATLLSLENKNHEVDSIKGLPIRGRQILHEIQPLFPQVVSCSFSETYIFTDSLSQGKPQTIVIFGVQPESLNLQSKQRVLEWLKARIENKNVEALFIDAKSVNKDSSSTVANKK
jgi:hypothetical protein